MKLTVRYTPSPYPSDDVWLWRWSITDNEDWEKWHGWRPDYPSALKHGLEKLNAEVNKSEIRARYERIMT